MIPAFIYCVIAVGFAIPTLLEGNAKSLGWGIYRFAGLAACAAWPLFVLVAAAACLTQKAAAGGDDGVRADPER
jgi:hypothetical protein